MDLKSRMFCLAVSVFPAVSAFAFNPNASSTLPGGMAGAPESAGFSPGEVVGLYKAAVARGELAVFGTTLSLSMIRPTRVEYVFDLVGNGSRVEVYSEFVTPLDAPIATDCKAYGVSAVITVDGRIVDTEVHVWPSEK
jgi:hypothetical protein